MKKQQAIPENPARMEIRHITVLYDGEVILQDVDFIIPHGAQVAVVGPNGAGKSTLFKAMVGLIPLQEGEIHIHGEPLGRHTNCVAYIPQREEVDWRYPITVEEVVMMGRYGKFGWLGRPTKRDRAVVRRCMTQLGITDLANRSIGELSGGQQQRVFLARALAQEPHILLMDEPFTGVDSTTQETILRLLDALQEEGVTTLVSTHDLKMAAERFDQTLLLNRKLIAFGTPAEVFTQEHIGKAFGDQLLKINGAVVVDQCCHSEDGEVLE